MQVFGALRDTPQLLAAVLALLVAIGSLGSALEALGERLQSAPLVAIGQRLEAFGTDVPKLIRGSRLTKYIAAKVANWGAKS